MAYIVGLLTEEEEKILRERGWEVEEAPESLIDDLEPKGLKMKMVYVDTDMFTVMSGPDWQR